MTPKERAAMKLALEALELHLNGCGVAIATRIAYDALRGALDHFGEANEMVGCAYCNNPLFAGTKCNNCGLVTLAEPQVDWKEEALRLGGLNAKHVGELRKLKAEQAEQEPVAWAYIDADGSFMDALDRQHGAYKTPLYAAPVRTKDLTDDEMEDLCRKYARFELIREAIAADREKNK